MRKLMWFALGFGAACCLCSYCYFPWLIWIGVGSGILAVFAFLASQGRFDRTFKIIGLLLIGMTLGLTWFFVFNSWYLADAREKDGITENLLVVADDYGRETQYGSTVEGTCYLGKKSYKIRIYLNSPENTLPGDLLEGEFLLTFTADAREDSDAFSRGEGIFLIGYQKDTVKLYPGAYFRWYHYPAVWSQNLKVVLDTLLPADVAGFGKALLLGDKTDLNYETDTNFKTSGISHVVAVSGLHVSILFSLIYLFTGKHRFLTGLIGIPAVVLFTAIAGFSPSVTRAAIMQILMMVALMTQREYDPPTALAVSVLVILVLNPMGITSVSLQLSAACMAGIFLFCERIRQWFLQPTLLGRWKKNRILGKLINGFSSSVAVSVSATILTAPLCGLYFGMVSLVGVLTNLLTLWAVSVVFYGILLACAVSGISTTVAYSIGTAISWLIRYIYLIADMLAAFPLSAVYTRSAYIVIWILMCYGLLAIFLRMKKKSVPLFAGTAVVGLIISLSLSWLEPMTDKCRVSVLDVGQGQCILLQSDGHTFLVDCGGGYPEGAADTAAEALLAQGISRVDGVILTHFDADHSGGLVYLLTRIDADALYFPYIQDTNGVGTQLALTAGLQPQYVSEDLLIRYADTKITLFAPDSYNSGNESSVCILFQVENYDILITGDRGEQGEQMLLKRNDIPELELLIVGHHGAKDSASEFLLKATKPRYAMISVGEGNSYGHPSDEVLERLDQYGCMVYRTDLHGDIVFRR